MYKNIPLLDLSTYFWMPGYISPILELSRNQGLAFKGNMLTCTQMDASTALCGSAPGFFALVLEAAIDGE